MKLSKIPLGECIEDLQPGFASGKDVSDGVRQVRMNNVKPDGTWDWEKVRRVPATGRQLERYSLLSGDILFNATNSVEQVGKSALHDGMDEPVTFSNHFWRIRVRRKVTEPAYVVRYLGYLWQRRVFQNMVDAWVNQATVQRDALLSTTIPLPPLPDQKRIIAILDKADAIRRKRQQAIQLADEFLRAVFLDKFGDPVTNPKAWDTAELSDVVAPGTIVTYGIVQAGPHVEGGVPYIRTGDFKNGRLVDDGYARTSPEIASKFKRSEVRAGDLVYCIRASVGAVDIVPKYLDGANLTQGTARISCGERVLPEFLVEQLRTRSFRSWVDRNVKGATFKEITLANLRKAPVVVPPIEEQRKFVRVWSAKRNLERLHGEVAELPAFEALSQKAFAGAL